MRYVTPEYLAELDRAIRNPGIVRLEIYTDNGTVLAEQYTNSDIIRASFSMHTSPVAAEIPQMDFSVTLDNTDMEWDYENPTSIINTLSTLSVAILYMGYELDDGTEEAVCCGQFNITDIRADEFEATLSGTGVLQGYSGKIRNLQGGGRSGMWCEYYADRLGEQLDSTRFVILCSNAIAGIPVTRVEPASPGEILQALAVGCGGNVVVTRDEHPVYQNRLEINLTYDKITPSVIGSTVFDGISYAIQTQTVKSQLNYLYPSYLPVDGSTYLLDNLIAGDDFGFVSAEVSDASGEFSTEQYIELRVFVDHHAPCVSGLHLEFGTTLPSSFTIYTTRNGSTYTNIGTVNSNITQHMTITDLFDSTESIVGLKIVFNTMAVPFTPATLDYVRVIPTAGYLPEVAATVAIERNDMTSRPIITRDKEIGEIRVPYVDGVSDFELSNYPTVTFYDEDVTVNAGDEVEFTLAGSKASLTEYDAENEKLIFSDMKTSSQWVITDVRVDGGSTFSETIDYNTVTIKFAESGTHHVTITGRVPPFTEGVVSYKLSDTGEVMTVDVPIGVPSRVAQMVARRLAERYVRRLNYEVDNRGSFEIDPCDVVLFESKTAGLVPMMVTDIDVNFDGGFTGKISGIRWD